MFYGVTERADWDICIYRRRDEFEWVDSDVEASGDSCASSRGRQDRDRAIELSERRR